jgi:CheY-like chemotaxis protein
MLPASGTSQHLEFFMRIRKDPVLGTWQMAESESMPWQSVHRRPGLVQRESNRFMIVDDDKNVRALFERSILRACPDFEITMAENGAEAVNAFKELHHAIIIMDILMPVMDGQRAFESILEHCREQKWEMPSVIFCTGCDPSNTVREAVAADGIHCMLQKPVSPKVLTEAVKARI